MSRIEQKNLVMPTNLDNPPKLLFWDMDQSMLFLVMVVFGMMMHYTFTMTILGGVAAFYWQKFKGGANPWMIIHSANWYFPLKTKSVRTGLSGDREYLG